MPKLELIKNSLAGGEIAPSLYSRIDLNLYTKAAKTLKNFYCHPHGGASNRPGTIYQATAKYDNKKIRLLPFKYSTLQNYILEFGDYYSRFYTNLAMGGQISQILTSEYSTDSYTSLLMHCNGAEGDTSFTDEAGNAITNSAIVDSYTKLCSHFNGADAATAYSDTIQGAYTFYGAAQLDTAQKKFGSASLLLNGTTDYVTLPDSPDFYFGTGALTMDFQARFTALPSVGAPLQTILSQKTDGNNFYFFNLAYADVSNFSFRLYAYVAGLPVLTLAFTFPQSDLAINTWYHFALVRTSNTWKLFVNGTQKGGDLTAANEIPDYTGILNIGCDQTTSNFFNGWIDELRISKGIARWTTNFTAPTAAYGGLYNTILQYKLGTGSGYFNGMGYLTIPQSLKFDFGVDDFTIETFVRFEALGDCYFMGNGAEKSGGWGIKYDNTAHTAAFWANGSSRATVSFTPNINTWYHISVIRNIGTIKLSVDGTFGGGSSYATSITSIYDLTIGEDSQEATAIFNGWLDEIRISKGIARWTANFTPGSAGSTPYEIVMPYAEADLPLINYTQSADVMYLAHPRVKPKELIRIDNTHWTIADYDYVGGPFMLPNTDAAKTIASSVIAMISKAITKVEDYSGTIAGTIKITSSGHGLSTNDYVTLVGTTTYDGTYILTKIDSDSFYVTATYVATSTGTWYKDTVLTAAGFTFQSGHINSLWQLQHYIEGQVANTAFGSSTTGAVIICGGTWRLITHGTWTGKLKVERSADGVTGWTMLREFTSADDYNANTYGTEDMSDNAEPFYVRLNMSTYASGTCNADLTTDAFYQKGIAKIMSVAVGGVTAIAMVKRTIGLTSATIDWAEGAWSDYRGWPSVVEFSPQDRLMWANTKTQPQTHWDTKIGNYNDFSRSNPLVDDDGITADLPAREVNGITSLIPLSTLIALTSGSEWGILSSTGAAITPTSILHRVYGYEGSSGIRPIVIGNRAIYVQVLSTIVRDLGYELYSDSFTGADISILSNHFFSGHSIIEMAYQQNPDRLVWCVRDDGKLLSLTFMREQEVIAWTQHDTNDGDDLFESVASIPNATNNYNEVWFSVKRGTARYIERMAQRLATTNSSDQIFMDSTITYDGTPANVITGLSHLNGYTVAILADGNVLTQQVVSGGTLTLPTSYSKVHIGIPYNSDLETLNIEVNMPDGTLQGRKVKVSQVALRVVNSRGGYIGPDSSTLHPISGSNMADWNNPNVVSKYDATGVLTLCTGEIKENLGAGYEDGGRVFLRQSDPLPITVVGILPLIQIGGRTAE